MSMNELEAMTEVSDLQPSCPAKAIGWEELNPFGPQFPITPVPVDGASPGGGCPEPRRWQYRVC